MAIYRLSADIVRRSVGRTVTAAAAYRAGELIVDDRTGLVFDYRRRRGVLDAAILAPENAPAWILDRARLWNAVERAEKRKDAQLAREIELALPHELTPAARRELVHGFVRAVFVAAGMVGDIAIHAPGGAGDARNVHAHVLLTMRAIAGDGFGPKVRGRQVKVSRAKY
jgi:ATP-dependent exoDNAse (exonuclease V) alpha subunit